MESNSAGTIEYRGNGETITVYPLATKDHSKAPKFFFEVLNHQLSLSKLLAHWIGDGHGIRASAFLRETSVLYQDSEGRVRIAELEELERSYFPAQ